MANTVNYGAFKHTRNKLETRILEPTPENAKIVWDVSKNEDPEDFKYMWYSVSHKSHLTESVEETQMKLDYESQNGCAYYIFHNNKFIGCMRVHY